LTSLLEKHSKSLQYTVTSTQKQRMFGHYNITYPKISSQLLALPQDVELVVLCDKIISARMWLSMSTMS